MPEIQILNPGCNDDCDDDCDKHRDDDCKRGKRGKRGHRGHRGHRGQDGGGGLLKFSGFAAAAAGTAISFLADQGVGLGTEDQVIFAPSYPVAIPRNLRNLAVNVLRSEPALATPPFVLPQGGSILVELLQGTVPVLSVLYNTPGPIGIMTAASAPIPYGIGSTFDLRVTTIGLGVLEIQGVYLSATVGVE